MAKAGQPRKPAGGGAADDTDVEVVPSGLALNVVRRYCTSRNPLSSYYCS